jgi:hypothetical protein
MAKVAKLPRVSSEIQDAFVGIWVESKMLPLRVGHRPIMAAALRVLMPGGRLGSPLMLYRGANIHERRRRKRVRRDGRGLRFGHGRRCVAARADGRPPGGLPSHVCLNVPFRFPSCAKWHPEATSWRTRSCVK